MSETTVDVETIVTADDPPKETVTSGIRALLPFARPAAIQLLFSALIAAVAALFGLAPYWVIYQVVVELMVESPNMDWLWLLVGIALAAVLTRFVLNGLANYVAHNGAFRIQYDIRMSLAEHLARLPLGFVTRRRSGELKKVMADDVERLELFLAHAIPDLTAALVTFVALFSWMVWVDWRMALAVFGLAIPAFFAIAFAMRKAGHHMQEYKTTQGEMNAAIVELIRGMPVVKTFNRDEDEVRGTERVIQRYVSVTRDYSLEFLPFGTMFYVLLGSNVLLVMPVGGWLWSAGALSTADLLFFLIVGLGALSTLVALLFLFANLSHIASGGKLVADILEQSQMAVSEDAHTLPQNATVQFEDVAFKYEDDWVLNGVNFIAQAGTLTALVGPSGGGKSTIAALICRFWDSQSGSIKIGGVPIKSMSPDTLCQHVSMVLQENFLFDDTIGNNLKVGNADASDVQLVEAARKAQIHDTIMSFPEGYYTQVGEHGVRLSGGEKQRLAIARAILADAPIIVLDEATAFVDPENENALQQAIGELVVAKTVIMIAHRLSTIVGADQILVVDHGRIVERGQHDDLVAQAGLYARLWEDFNTADNIVLGDAKGV